MFDAALSTLLNSILGVDTTYNPSGGPALAIRGALVEPDVDILIGTTKAKDQKRVLVVRQADAPAVAVGETFEVPAGSSHVFRVANVTARDPMRLAWSIELAPQ